MLSSSIFNGFGAIHA